MVKISIGENDSGQRLDRYLKKRLKKAPLSSIYRIIRKDLKLNGRRSRPEQILEAGDELILYITREDMEALEKTAQERKAKKQFKVVYEDNNVIIADKPSGLLTHGDAKEKKNTLTNQVIGYLKDAGEYNQSLGTTFAPAPVNRLDRNTSGLVIFGKNAQSQRTLAALIRGKNIIKKYYLTIVVGKFDSDLYISERLDKSEGKNLMAVVKEGGKLGETRVRLLTAGDHFSLVEVELITGRTHQIRAHLAYEGYPLAGDPKYGNAETNYSLKPDITSQLLHAYKLEFNELPEPLRGLSYRTIKSAPPKTFRKMTEKLIGDNIVLW